MIRRSSYIVLFSLISAMSFAQVNWLSFEALDSALNEEKKPVFIEFTTTWCTYCKKMDQEVFPNEEIVSILNQDFYAVRFDAESDQVVHFDGGEFIRKPNSKNHEIAMTLATREGQFTPPVLIFLDDEFQVQERIFSYQSRKRLLSKLKKHR